MLPAAKRRKNKAHGASRGWTLEMNKPRRGARKATSQAPEAYFTTSRLRQTVGRADRSRGNRRSQAYLWQLGCCGEIGPRRLHRLGRRARGLRPVKGPVCSRCPDSEACQSGSQAASPAEYSRRRTRRKPHRGCRDHMGGVRGDPRLRQPMAYANHAAGSDRGMCVGHPCLAAREMAPLHQGRLKKARSLIGGPGYPFPKGSSSDGLCCVNNSAPFSVTCISSSRRIPNSPRM